MLMVLMAIIELGRSGLSRVLRWASMVLSGSLFAGAPGCLSPEGRDPGPQVDLVDAVEPRDAPPPELLPGDTGPGDVPTLDQPVEGDLPRDCPQVTYYGPQPCETDEDCRQRNGPGWYCDTAHVFTDPCGGSVNWPLCLPGDVVEPVDALPPDAPTDLPTDCPPMVAYGPPPCTSDEDCRNWAPYDYCDKDHPITDPCTGATWYMCTQRPESRDVIEGEDLPSLDVPEVEATDLPGDEPVVVLYGPPPPNPSR